MLLWVCIYLLETSFQYGHGRGGANLPLDALSLFHPPGAQKEATRPSQRRDGNRYLSYGQTAFADDHFVFATLPAYRDTQTVHV